MIELRARHVTLDKGMYCVSQWGLARSLARHGNSKRRSESIITWDLVMIVATLVCYDMPSVRPDEQDTESESVAWVYEFESKFPLCSPSRGLGDVYKRQLCPRNDIRVPQLLTKTHPLGGHTSQTKKILPPVVVWGQCVGNWDIDDSRC